MPKLYKLSECLLMLAEALKFMIDLSELKFDIFSERH